MPSVLKVPRYKMDVNTVYKIFITHFAFDDPGPCIFCIKKVHAFNLLAKNLHLMPIKTPP